MRGLESSTRQCREMLLHSLSKNALPYSECIGKRENFVSDALYTDFGVRRHQDEFLLKTDFGFYESRASFLFLTALRSVMMLL